eukprot:CAMPEP_0169206240 /NCGR_PEP_ID=MMETSP1016-20121227/12936_1 /TAXON_ID=342587 /ORGANISM="Karlodinium micrum, Strain CCMP2283" /LENGTH=41 /DNA_ID= /DNA_START= /DNA_END= /DNA_ORIENTATION=
MGKPRIHVSSPRPPQQILQSLAVAQASETRKSDAVPTLSLT